MSFYIKPPSGNISLEKLEKFAFKRLDFLIRVLGAGDDFMALTDLVKDLSLVADSDCFIEGTKKDQVSHFILRMAFSKDAELWRLFKKAETSLFNFRFQCMKPEEIFCSLKPVWKSAATISEKENIKQLSFEGVLKVFMNIAESCGGLWASVIDKYYSGCKTDYFCIPFIYVLKLVSERRVRLERGDALVPFCRLHHVMTALFELMLESSRQQFQKILLNLIDERIEKLFANLQKYFQLKCLQCESSRTASSLSHDIIDAEEKYFPPCMSYLHRELRTKHRLKHHARIRYTLFLKEAGLPVHEAIMFWRNEYSQSCADAKTAGSCNHTWHKDEKRYVYNIRHLYGLEGSRVNYRAHTCSHIQVATDGCPFVSFHEQNLKKLLKETPADIQEDIKKLVQKKRYCDACRTFVAAKFERASPEDCSVAQMEKPKVEKVENSKEKSLNSCREKHLLLSNTTDFDGEEDEKQNNEERLCETLNPLSEELINSKSLSSNSLSPPSKISKTVLNDINQSHTRINHLSLCSSHVDDVNLATSLASAKKLELKDCKLEPTTFCHEQGSSQNQRSDFTKHQMSSDIKTDQSKNAGHCFNLKPVHFYELCKHSLEKTESKPKLN
ncbi:DNA primase large subunit isoform X1 [Octopus sinensis]|nr:DNA primase large subunit isoform X1 [Octopus sinensis]